MDLSLQGKSYLVFSFPTFLVLSVHIIDNNETLSLKSWITDRQTCKFIVRIRYIRVTRLELYANNWWGTWILQVKPQNVCFSLLYNIYWNNLRVSKYKPIFHLQMLNWIKENRQEFLLNYSEIGHDSATAEELEEEHRNFESSCMVSIKITSVLISLQIFVI